MSFNKIKFDNLCMKDLLSSEDVEKLRDLWPYLKCSSCGELMIEPKMCITCNKNLCHKCSKKNCNHETIISRHLKSILEHNRFQCKFFGDGCSDNNHYDYFKLKCHAENCPAFREAYCNKSNSMIDFKSANQANINDQLSKVLSSFDNKLNETTYIPAITLTFKPITLKDTNLDNSKDNKQTFTCTCGEIFSGQNIKENYLNHKKNCIQKKDYEFNQKEEDNKVIKDKLIGNFMVKIEKLQRCFAESSRLKHIDYLKKVDNDLTQFKNDLDKKEQMIQDNEKEISEYYKSTTYEKEFVPEHILNSNSDYVSLSKEEKDLIREKNDLENKLENATRRFSEKKSKGEKEIQQIAIDYKNKLQQYEIEEAWLKETISQYNPGIISSVFSDSDTCSSCKNANVNVKKYYCQECRKRFCAGSCAKICSTNTCSKISKYICPECVPKCGLCRKNVFCSDCKKPCFYSECKNVFCPDCYKRNSHQQRSANSNCAFFTCEVDKVKACLMTSLFCVKCEKRLCNNCLFNDKDHFNSLFK